MKKHFYFIVLISFILLNFGCKKNATEPVETLALTVEDVSCTEAWVKITTANYQTPNTLTLFVNDKADQNISLVSADTILYVDSLLPNQSYKIKAAFVTNNQLQPTNEVVAKTMDTTTHNFTWQTFTFGESGNSTLYDVAIIDENNIWAVGELHMNDSLGNPDPTYYNVAHWDGLKWELKKLFYKGGIWPIKTILAFNENDIWFSGYMRYHNGKFIELPIPDILMGWTINKMWGTSSNDLYAVGNNGNIAHYDGKNWKKIESGINIDLKDISGIPDKKEIWTCGWNYQTGQSMILKITGNDCEIIWDSEIFDPAFVYSGLLNSIAANGNNQFVFVGGQVYRQFLLGNRSAQREWVKTTNGSKVLELGNYGYRIKGSNKNNLFVAGDAAMLWHFNGYTWSKNSELYNTDDRLYGLAVTDNVIVAVGKRYSPGTLGIGLLIVGRR